MKVTLVSPAPSVLGKSLYVYESSGGMPPTGLLYVAGALLEAGHEVLLIDQAAEGLTNKAVTDRVHQFDSDVLGISALTSSAIRAAEIAQLAKHRNEELMVVMGNVHATFCADLILAKYPFVDFCVRGEGEETLVELIQNHEDNGAKKLQKIQGIVFRDKTNQIIFTENRPLIRDLDSLPFPDRSLLNAEYHIKVGEIALRMGKFTTVASSRGCPFNCTFCCCPTLSNRNWRPRSPENIADELELLASQGYDHFLFADDSFTVNSRRAIKLARIMRHRKLELDWMIEGRVDSASQEMITEIVRAGCRFLFFGMESANQRILKLYNKLTTPAMNKQAAFNARASGMDVIVGSFILGAPGETLREMHRTIEFAKQCDITFAQFNILGLSPGAPLWDEAIAKGYMRPDQYWETGILAAEIFPNSRSFEEIREIARNAFMEFSLRPRYLIRELFRTLSSPFRIRAMAASVSSIPYWANLRRLYQYQGPQQQGHEEPN